MRSRHSSAKALVHMFPIALLSSALSGSSLAGEIGPIIEVTNESKDVASPRILAKDVRLTNVDAFEAQLRRDLPLGTSRSEVEAYLARLQIKHVYSAPHNAYQAAIDDIGVRLVFQASLEIFIHLDADQKVKEIRFHIQYL